jgi:hypothetical protein
MSKIKKEMTVRIKLPSSKIKKAVTIQVRSNDPEDINVYEADVITIISDDEFGPFIEDVEITEVRDCYGTEVKLTNDIIKAVRKEIEKVDLYA